MPINLGSWSISFKKNKHGNSHKYFCMYNTNTANGKTFNNNTLKQEASFKLFGYKLVVVRKRSFASVLNINNFIQREDKRIGSWS